jgi:chromosome segregation ATPase
MPVALRADNHQPAEVADRLAYFESTAIDLRREIGSLESLARAQQGSFQGHSDRLNSIRAKVNELGKEHSQLEEMKPQASELQVKAIDSARPHLEELAQEVKAAIERLGAERTRTLRSPEYRDSLKQMYDHANALYTTVDTIIDYKDARNRLKGLNLPPNGM